MGIVANQHVCEYRKAMSTSVGVFSVTQDISRLSLHRSLLFLFRLAYWQGTIDGDGGR
jgi:hypothetical protein